MGLRRSAAAHPVAGAHLPDGVRRIASRPARAVGARRHGACRAVGVTVPALRGHVEGAHPRRGVQRSRCRPPRGDAHPEHHHLRRPGVGPRAVVGDPPPPRSRSAPVGRGRARRGDRSPQQAPRPVPGGVARGRDPDRPPIRRPPLEVAPRRRRAGVAHLESEPHLAGDATGGRRSTWLVRSRERTAPRTGPSSSRSSSFCSVLCCFRSGAPDFCGSGAATRPKRCARSRSPIRCCSWRCSSALARATTSRRSCSCTSRRAASSWIVG